MPENAKNLNCDICNFVCSKQSNYEIHLTTTKHKNLTSPNKLGKKNAKKTFQCYNCKKIYKHASTLSTHKKNCNKLSEPIIVQDEENENYEEEENIVRDASSNEMKILTSLVFEIFKSNNELQQQNMEMQKQNQEFQKQQNLEIQKQNQEFQKQQNLEILRQNQEFQKQIMEVVCKNIQQTIPTTVNNTVNANTNNNNTINANKTFNLNFFLNEQCKNAMNLKDFVDSMEVTLEDAEKIGEEGYVEGMSSLVIKKINETDVFLRPIHCSDSKRDILHIKRNDKWERDGPNNEHLTMAIKYIEQKNMVALDQMGEKYPDWKDIDSPHNDKYMNMILKLTDSGPEEYKKVVKKIIKEVVIDKENV